MNTERFILKEFRVFSSEYVKGEREYQFIRVLVSFAFRRSVQLNIQRWDHCILLGEMINEAKINRGD